MRDKNKRLPLILLVVIVGAFVIYAIASAILQTSADWSFWTNASATEKVIIGLLVIILVTKS